MTDEKTKSEKVEEKESKTEKKHESKKEEITATKKKEEKKEAKLVLEREYVIPLRRGTETVPRFKKARKAIKVIREFIARHMKTEDRNLLLVRIDRHLNNEIWFRGIKHIPSKIKVKAKKFDSGEVWVELADVPDVVKFIMERERKQKAKGEKAAKKTHIEHEEKPEETPQEKQEEKEKEKAVVEAGLKAQKQEAKEMKHTNLGKPDQKVQIHKTATKR